jgi:hypothetical protein
MNYTFLLVGLLASFPGLSQRIVLPHGEYMDTSSTRNLACVKAPIVRYYSVEGKYPRSSETLAEQAQAFISRKGQHYVGDGHVTFRFIIDCQGQREPRTQVLQTDTQYRRTTLPPGLVDELYAFLQTLTDWKVGKAPVPVRYIAYLNFKLRDGKVVAVTP